jgi:tetratricopeptide (TPR) repeat protein
LNQERIQLRDKILKLLQKQEISSSVDLEKRKRQQNQRLVAFYFGSKNLEHAEKAMNRKQEKTHDVEMLEGQVLLEKGSLNEALKCFMRAELKLKEEGKTEETDYANALYYIGWVNMGKGDYEQALVHYQRCLTIEERVKGKDAIDCATTLNNIGSVYDDKGDYEQALLYYQRCLTIQERVKSKDAIDCATTLNNMGNI